MDLGATFWLSLIGLAFAIGVGCAVTLVLIGVAWYAWGILGTFLAIAVVALVIGYVQDRRDRERVSPLRG
jgi:hypothetical protein